MDIKTKFSVGDTVYYMKENRVKSDVVSTIRVKVKGYKRGDYKGGAQVDISYGFWLGNLAPDSADFCESILFGSKEELLESL